MRRRRKGYKLNRYITVTYKMINKIIYCRRLKKSNAFVYDFKQNLFARTLPSDCCLITKAVLPPPTLRVLRKRIKHT